MRRALKILIVEDNADDAELILSELRRAGFDPLWKRVETPEEFLAEIQKGPDIILSDFSMPRFNGLRAAELLQRSGLNIPFILISGTVGEEVAVEAMKHGATDYLLKDRITRLGAAVERALKQKLLLDEREKTAETLLQAGALQRAIFSSANFSSIATDEKGVIQIFNVGAERMLGYTAAEVMNRITPADISDSHEVIARASALSAELGTEIAPGFEALIFKASRGIEDIYELTYIRKDGSRFPAVVSVTALRDGQGVIIGYLLIGTDNTARKRAEEALLKAGALQNAIFKSANFSCIATDAKGLIQIFNAGAERMLGYKAEEVVNRITPAELHEPQEVLKRAELLEVEYGTKISPGFGAVAFKASHGIEDIYELTKVRKDGSRFPAVLFVTALRDAQGGIIGYLLIGTDNTARHQVEEERKRFERALQDTNLKLEIAKSAAEKANLAKSDFLSSMSHELRTPLNGIIGFTEFLIDEKPGPLRPKQMEYLGDVLNSARHLLQLINDVLDLAKVEAGKMELHPELFAVDKAVDEVVAVIKGIANKRSLTVGIEVGPGLEAVTLDQHKFKQILYNLLSNAVKFSDDGGNVGIRAHRWDGEWLRVQVCDEGIGIRPEDISRLFAEFEQLDFGASRRFEGTGLGLALTRKFIEFQGGRIGVESELGKGSTFTVLLPLTTHGVAI